jgi:hypothetical protein
MHLMCFTSLLNYMQLYTVMQYKSSGLLFYSREFYRFVQKERAMHTLLTHRSGYKSRHSFDGWQKSRVRWIRLRIDGKPHANRRCHLATVFAHARAHGTRPRRHRDVAAEVLPFHRHGVHAARKGVLLLLHTDPHHTLRWHFRRGARRSGFGPRKQHVDVACDVRGRAAALGAVVREQ